MVEILFWLSLVLIAYTYIGYPACLALLCRLRRRPLQQPVAGCGRRDVSVLVVVHNGAPWIEKRLRNLVETATPEVVEFILICDGCTDDSEEIARSFSDPRLRVIPASRMGKVGCLNLGLSLALGELVVLTDIRQRFAPGAIAGLVRHFSRPDVGAVSGNLQIEPSESGAGQGLDLYWRLEKFIRHCESRLDSSIGCTGAIYAIRRELFRAVPDDTLLDDVVIPMQIANQGYRILFDPEAIAWEPQKLDPVLEKRRKMRTLTGNFQMLFRYPGWLLPWNCRLWWKLISHKYLRLFGGIYLTVALVSSIILAEHSDFFRMVWIAQGICFILAAIGLTFPKMTHRLFTIPAGFVFLQWSCLRALGNYFTSGFTRSRSRRIDW